MKREGKKVVPSLSNLIEKFSQEDVIAVMEKEYQAAPARLIPTSLIDDTSFIKDIVIPKDVVSSFAAGLKEKGFYNPLIVRSKGDRFELILGRKRFFGAKKAGILSLPCVVRDAEDEEVSMEAMVTGEIVKDEDKPEEKPAKKKVVKKAKENNEQPVQE